ncbi:MAG: PLDc N-terminal domain-containing protein [Desulfovibrio sp.]|nr:PLDc N-terminal domain-containing protein [Desulfovibrio sp.]
MSFEWWHLLVALLPMLPTFWSIWHIWAHEFENPQQRALWLVLVVFVPVLGGIIYIVTGRRKALSKIQKQARG